MITEVREAFGGEIKELCLSPEPCLVKNNYTDRVHILMFRGVAHDNRYDRKVVRGRLIIKDRTPYIESRSGEIAVEAETVDRQMHWTYKMGITQMEMYENDVVLVFDRNTYNAYLCVTHIDELTKEEVLHFFCPTHSNLNMPLEEVKSRNLYIRRVGTMYKGGVDPDEFIMTKFAHVGVYTPNSQLCHLLTARYKVLHQQMTLTDFIQYVRLYNTNLGREVSGIFQKPVQTELTDYVASNNPSNLRNLDAEFGI